MELQETHTTSRKYEPLTEFLRRQPRGMVKMSFDQIERVIAARLPPSATRHRAWWSNNAQNNVMTRAWKDAGFESEEVDMKGRRVVFRRVGSGSRGPGTPAADVTTAERHPLIGWMKGTLAVAEGVDLTQPADPEWSEAAIGGLTGADRK